MGINPMHLDEEQLQRLLHGELGRPGDASAREHLAACADCRRRLALAEREEANVHALLRAVDDPAPSIDAGAVATRAREPDWGWARRAAGVILALGVAGAVYAAPGSPLPAWVKAVVGWVGGREGPSTSVPPSVDSPDPRVAGIAVAPGRELVILFTARQTVGLARISLTDGAEVVVRAPIGAATYTSDQARLVIDNAASSATFEIEIPHAAPLVEIRVDGQRVFLKAGPRVTTGGYVDAPPGPYLLPLAP